MKSYVIHLIRNAPCEGNLEGRYIGRTESPLAMQSIQELVGLKKEFIYPEAQGFYASPSTRCVDTLKILYPEADPEVILEMAECDFGDWEGRTAQELQQDEKFRAWMEEGGQNAPPNGESGAVFLQRVLSGFEMLVQNMMSKGGDLCGAGDARRRHYGDSFRLRAAPPIFTTGCVRAAAVIPCVLPRDYGCVPMWPRCLKPCPGGRKAKARITWWWIWHARLQIEPMEREKKSKQVGLVKKNEA